MHRALAVAAVITLAMPLGAQAPAFEVASIRRNTSGAEGGFRSSLASLAGRGVTLGALTFGLSGRVGRVVENRTGIEGEFDFDLEFAPDVNSPGPSIFTVLEEQLGVRLESTRGPARIMRIDSIERPTEN